MAARYSGRHRSREQGSICSSSQSCGWSPSPPRSTTLTFGSVCHLLKNLKVRLLLSPLQPPPSPLHRPLGFVESFSKMFIMSYYCWFHLPLTHGGLAPLQGLEVRLPVPGKVQMWLCPFSSVMAYCLFMTQCNLSFK
jgi:hypothetical protein